MSDAHVAVRSSKRKRAQVSYYEGEPDYAEDLDSEHGTEEVSPSKKAKAKSRPLPKRKIFPLLSLPAELRNMIYELALTDNKGVFLTSKTEHYRRVVVRHHPDLNTYNRRRHLDAFRRVISDGNSDEDEEDGSPQPVSFVPSLLAVNRQINTEALAVLYSNKFTVEDTTALHTFVANLAPRSRELLEDITIQGWGYSRTHKALNHPGLTMLAFATNLKRVHFQCRLGWSSTPSAVARQIYRDGFHWLEAVGVAKGKTDAAVDIITLADHNLTGRVLRRTTDAVAPTSSVGRQMFEAEMRKLLGYKKPTGPRKSKGKSKGKGKADDE